MCGRFALHADAETIAQTFELDEAPELSPRYNIAPTQPAPVVLTTGDNAHREFRTLRWGLIPSWAKDAVIGAKMINARAETVAEKPAFRSAFTHRRCLILADGFYEWQKLGRGKQPIYIRLKSGEPFAFAGLWERWESPDDGPIESCTIITTTPNDLVQPIHDRMPVILHRESYGRWLDPGNTNSEALATLLTPYSANEMEAYSVSARVNSAANDDPTCIERI